MLPRARAGSTTPTCADGLAPIRRHLPPGCSRCGPPLRRRRRRRPPRRAPAPPPACAAAGADLLPRPLPHVRSGTEVGLNSALASSLHNASPRTLSAAAAAPAPAAASTSTSRPAASGPGAWWARRIPLKLHACVWPSAQRMTAPPPGARHTPEEPPSLPSSPRHPCAGVGPRRERGPGALAPPAPRAAPHPRRPRRRRLLVGLLRRVGGGGAKLAVHRGAPALGALGPALAAAGAGPGPALH